MMTETTKTETNETYTVAEWRLEELDTRVAKLNRRAEKCGKAALVGYRIVAETFKDEVDEGGKTTGRKLRFVEIEFTGSAPVVEGWEFLARIEHTEAGNLISRAPGAREVALPESVKTDAPRCDHCGTKRNRKDTFIIREVSTGTMKMIGRNCLADYLRTDDVADAVRIFTFLDELKTLSDHSEEDCLTGGGGGGRAWYFGVRPVLAAAARAVELWGWVSKSTAWEENEKGRSVIATASRVSFILTPPRCPTVEDAREWEAAQPGAAHDEEADKVIAWANEELATRTDLGDYLNNVKVAICGNYAGRRTFGIVVSAVVAYRREKGLDPRTGRPVVKVTGGWVSEVGKRLRNVPVTVTNTSIFDGNFGPTTLITMVDAEGNQFKTFATNGSRFDNTGLPVHVDGRYTVTGTVKKHEEFRGTKSTIINRCAFVQVDPH